MASNPGLGQTTVGGQLIELGGGDGGLTWGKYSAGRMGRCANWRRWTTQPEVIA